jgi:capsular exopolysaccharide synthesis family protein
MGVLQEQIDASRSQLEARLKADYDRAIRDEALLNSAMERTKSEAVRENQDSIQYGILKSEVETAKQLYVDFLQKTSQANVQVAEQHNNMRVIEPAQVPSSPVGPQRVRSIMIGLFLSLLGGLGLAFVLERLDNTIKTVEDVNRYAQLPALGIIPAIDSRAPRKFSGYGKARAIGSGPDGARVRDPQRQSVQLTALNNRSSAAEAYRGLRTSVLLSAAGGPPKVVMVTSGQPGEGKTTTVVNTAISLAQLGSSVLIIDADLRRPTTHKVFGVQQLAGLSSYLSRDIKIDSVIQKLSIPNLSLIPCGPIPPNPAELVSSEKMKEMLRILSQRYDHILIDSPPLMHVTDPVIISTLVDGVILVVHGGKSTREVVKRARQDLASVGAKVFGVVLNNLDLKREGYDEYYYYYRYYAADGSEA